MNAFDVFVIKGFTVLQFLTACMTFLFTEINEATDYSPQTLNF